MRSITDLLIDHEGLELKPYTDTAGKVTIGVGRNLDEVGITESEALYLLENDIGRVRAELDQALPWWREMDEVRQQVMIDLGFNLGVLTPPDTAKLLTFTLTLSLLKSGRYEAAADNLEKTLWHKQVGRRALVLERMLREPVEV